MSMTKDQLKAELAEAKGRMFAHHRAWFYLMCHPEDAAAVAAEQLGIATNERDRYGHVIATYGLGLNPGEIVAVPSELPDPENWECEVDSEIATAGQWLRVTASGMTHRDLLARRICRPINKEAGE